MTDKDIESALGEWTTSELIELLRSLGDREELYEAGWELWDPEQWLRLDDALAGWDTSEAVGTQTDGPYIGPAGIGIAGNAGEDMICLVEDRPGHLATRLVKWDQTIGAFEPLE